MKIETKKLDRGQIELTIELTVEEYQPFLQKAAETISKEKKIAGFRPGKASLGIVIQQVGEQAVWQEALESAVQKTFVKALDQEKLLTIGSPQIEVIKLAPNNPVVYKTKVSLLPEIQLADYSKIKIKPKTTEITQDQVKKALTDIQKTRAAEIIVSREAKKDDKVEINFETFLDKIPVDQGKQEKFGLIIGENTFIPGFEEKIAGLKKDDTKEFQLEFPKEYHQKNLAGRLVDFKVKMLAVYEVKLPELNDEFAKGVGEFKTIKELEEKIKDNLKDQQATKDNQQFEEDLIDKISGQSTFGDIPDLLVDAEAKKMIQELEQNLAGQGLKFDDYLNHLQKKREDLLLDFAPQAIKRIKSALILREVAQTEKIEADDNEVEAEVQQTLLAYGDNPEVKKQIDQPAYRDYVKNIISARKVMDHLKSSMIEK